MKLTTVREIYKNREEYMNQEVTVGRLGSQRPWFQSIWIYCPS